MGAISRGLLGRGRRFNNRSWGCNLAESFDGTPVSAAATTASRRGGRLGDTHEGAIDVTQSTGLHALTAFGTTSGDDGAVDGIGGLINPFAFSLAASQRGQYIETGNNLELELTREPSQHLRI
jgi:hypothetical protein